MGNRVQQRGGLNNGVDREMRDVAYTKFYNSYHEAMRDLPKEQYGAVAFAINEYTLYGIEPDLLGIEKIIFTMAKPSIDKSVRDRENGHTGGRPTKHKITPLLEKEIPPF
jgi:hypothetical protein